MQQHGWIQIVILTEVSQTKKIKYYVLSLTCGILKKNSTNEFIYKTEIESQIKKQTYGYQEEGREEIN